MRKLVSFLFSFLIALTARSAVDAPAIQCISVLGNNDVVIKWDQPSDPNNEFDNYNIYFADQSGNFTKITTVSNFNQLSYTHTGVIPNGVNASYYLSTTYTQGASTNESSPSNIVSPMVPLLEDTLEAVASISWNSAGLNGTGWYQLYKSQGDKNSWVWVDSVAVGTNFYYDSIAVCSDSIYYRIELPSIGSCVSVSKVVGHLFQDNFAPPAPTIDSVSVDPSSGFVHVGWEESERGDVGGYIVALKIGSNWQFDTIWGKQSTYFLSTVATAFDKPEEFGLLAFDTCWSGNPLAPNTSASGDVHKTIFLNGFSDACTRSISIDWNKYETWPSGISNYDIFVSINGGPTTLLTSVSGTTTSFTHQGLTANSNYCYTVRGYNVGGDKSATSNRICVTMTVPDLPDNHYLNKVTVIDNSAIEVSCFVDTKAAISYYLVERSSSKNGPFTIIDRIYTPTADIITYTDYDVDPTNQNYYYKIAAVDVCGIKVNVSNTSTNVLTKVSNKSDPYINTLNWNPYSDWDTLGSGVAFYNIYKGYDASNMDDVPIAMVDGETVTYSDLIMPVDENEGKVCYYIEAVEAGGNLLAFKERSNSNVNCIKLAPAVYIPNAFTPGSDSFNDVFAPEINFIPANNYYFAIFSRYGKIIFETTSPEQGWDGGGSPTGVYNYLLRFENVEGVPFERVGSVTLLR